MKFDFQKKLIGWEPFHLWLIYIMKHKLHLEEMLHSILNVNVITDELIALKTFNIY